MKRNARGHLLVLALGVFLSVIAAASVGCGKSPTAPGGVYDPGKPIDTDNRPPCTIDGKTCREVTGQDHPLASLDENGVKMFKGDCTVDLFACKSENEVPLVGDPNSNTLSYELVGKYSDKWTARVCVDHPRVTGRVLLVAAVMGDKRGDDGFQEQERPNEVCVGAVFDMTVPGGVLNDDGGLVRFTEYSQDLLEANEMKKTVSYRVLYRP